MGVPVGGVISRAVPVSMVTRTYCGAAPPGLSEYVTLKVIVVPDTADAGVAVALLRADTAAAKDTAKTSSNRSAIPSAASALVRSPAFRRTVTPVMEARMARQGDASNGTAVLAPRTHADSGSRVRPIARDPK